MPKYVEMVASTNLNPTLIINQLLKQTDNNKVVESAKEEKSKK
jgi:hypothetical protein